MGEYVYDETPIPLGPRARRLAEQRNRTRVRQQRRLSANTMPEEDDLEIGGPGPVTDSGLSEQDVEAPDRTAAVREQVQALAGNVTQAAGQGLAQPQPPQTPQAAPATPPAGAQVRPPMGFDPEEDEQIGRIDAAMAPLDPTQRANVQALPTVGHEDSEENADMLIGASAREMGTPTPPSTQLRPPMSGPAPQAATPLRAPGVMASLEDDDIEPAPIETEVDEDDMEVGAPSQKGGAWDPEVAARAEDAATQRDLREESDGIREQHRRARIAATIASALGLPPEQAAGMMAPYDPQAPYERYAAEQAAEQERADADWRRQLEERRAGIEDRRIAQAESATESRNRRTSAEYDVDSTDAQAMRQAYSATIGNLSEEAARLVPGFVTTEYGGDLDLSQQTASGMTSLIDQLNRELARQQELSPRAFRLGRHGGGRARDPRGTLAGLGGGQASRGHDYGGPIGARPDDGSMPPMGDDVERPQPRTQTLPAGGGQRPQRGPAPAQGAPQASGPAPSGRPLVDREPTQAELAAMPPAERATAGLIRAYIRANPGTPYQDAVAAVQILQPTERSRIMTDYGSDSVVEVPGWVRTENINLAPRELQDLRAQNAATDRIISASRRMEELARNIGPAELARGAFTSDETMSLARNISREMQASMRALQNMGVPNGPEMAMALEQAGEIRTPVDLMRVQATYRALLRWAAEANASRMQNYGFARRRQQR